MYIYTYIQVLNFCCLEYSEKNFVQTLIRVTVDNGGRNIPHQKKKNRKQINKRYIKKRVVQKT